MTLYSDISIFATELARFMREFHPGNSGGTRYAYWEELDRCLQIDFTQKQKAIIYRAASPSLQIIFRKTDNFSVSEASEGQSHKFRSGIIHAFFDAARKNSGSLEIISNLLSTGPAQRNEELDSRLKQDVCRILIALEKELQNTIDNYRLICGYDMPSQIAYAIREYENRFLPRLRGFIAPTLSQTAADHEKIARYSDPQVYMNGKEHIGPIDPQEWANAAP